MSNLLIYVENNLTYSAEQCYQEETNKSKSNEKSSDVESINVPLISPQSTLNDTAFTFPSELPLSDESQKLSTITEENLQNQILKIDLPSTTCPLPKMNTNPFLQDESVRDQIKNELTPEVFMELWNENLKLQMQITATFHLLFDRVMKTSKQNTNGNPLKDESILKMMSKMFLNSNKDLPTSENLQSLQSPAGNKNLNCNNYVDIFQNTGIQNSIRDSEFNYPNYLTPKDNNVGMANQFSMNGSYSDSNTPFKETNPFRLSLAGKLQISDSNKENTCLNFNLVPPAQSNQEPVTEHNPTNFPIDTNYGISKNMYNEFMYNYNQHIFPNGSSNTNNVNNNSSILLSPESNSADHMWSVDNIASNMSKIIIDNPSVAYGINQAKEAKEYIEKSNEKILNFPNSNYESFVYSQYPKISPQTHVEKQKQTGNLFSESYFSPPRTSYTDRNQQPIVQTNEEMKVHTNDISNFSQTQFMNTSKIPTSASERTFNCESAKENCTSSSSWLPINSPLSFGLMDNVNIDEGYLTRPSTSNTSYRSSPLVQANSETEYNQQSLTRNISQLQNTPTKMWIKSIEEINTIQYENWNKMYSLSKENENIEASYDNNQQDKMEIMAMKDTGNLYVNINDTTIQNSYLTDTESKNIWKAHMFENAGYMEKKPSMLIYPSHNNKILFLPIKLPKCVIHIFHYQGEGWFLVDEFVKGFTDFKGSGQMMDFLCLLNVHVPIQEINQTQYSIAPLQLGGILLERTRFLMYGSTNLQLMPLKLILKLLNNLKIISRKNIDDAVKKEFTMGSIMHAAWTIIYSYGQFKYYIENSQQL